ncbi:hypothetical protein Nepgr_014130 [Nepenthes gracilis]|uniref:S-acyltransferase n=1 Tax=Nepenthes gracilis TaxID=150966 RepID=A0AAD3SKB2_NEPGR|nr:hypothetical protein Nepgr_014130 [Nepenthes gracilis]
MVMMLMRLNRGRSLLLHPRVIGRCAISCIFVVLTQFALLLLPLFLSSLSLFVQLLISGMVLLFVAGCGKCFRRLLQVHASAPAFVFFNILFIWGVYVALIRQAVSPLKDVLFNGELSMIVMGFFSIVSSDPGLAEHGSASLNELMESSISDVGTHSESSFSVRRVRYCKSCKAFVSGFDHHCPAFGNCIGQKNHVLFMVLLVGFITVEASYMTSAYHYSQRSQIIVADEWEINLKRNLAMSTMFFCLLQFLWQMVFLAWHLYCVCFNIKTDEWINWRRYPEFQRIGQSEAGQSLHEMKFKNPYDKGIFCNLKEFLLGQE